MPRPICETLESRRLLASHPLGTFTLLPDGTLEIDGTRKSDHISIASHGPPGTNIADIFINDQPFRQFDELTAIRVLAGAGNDTVTISGSLPIKVTFIGDKGNDTLTGGSLDDVLDGGKGNDIINGGGGNDTITGGAGRDTVNGNDGDDDIDGGAGNDNSDGGDGNDFIRGSAGNDLLRGSGGDDDIDGGSGNDDIAGDDGDDRIRGDLGNDHLDGGAGADDLGGGRGRNTVHGGDGTDSFLNDDNRKTHDVFDDRGQDEASENQSIAITDLPVPVLTSFNTSFPGSTIREIERETEDSGVIYKIDFFTSANTRNRARFTEAGEPIFEGNGGGGGDDAAGHT